MINPDSFIAVLRPGRRGTVLAMAACLALPFGAHAQSAGADTDAGSSASAAASSSDYPNRPIHFVVPFSAGSGTDVIARYFARKISELSSQPVIVDNKSGGNGFIAVKAVTGAPKDGYTIFVGSNSTLATNVALFRKLPYDPLKDLIPISGMGRTPIVLVVPAESPFKTLNDLIDASRAKPGARTVATGSAGYQLMGELFATRANIKLQNVPYRGTPEVINATISGQVDVGVAETASTLEFVKAGRLRALAVASQQRFPELPDVPTALELSIPGFAADSWTAAAAPAGTPKAVVDKLADLFARVLALTETREFAARQHMILMPAGPDELRALQREQIENWKGIATAARIELQ